MSFYSIIYKKNKNARERYIRQYLVFINNEILSLYIKLAVHQIVSQKRLITETRIFIIIAFFLFHCIST